MLAKSMQNLGGTPRLCIHETIKKGFWNVCQIGLNKVIFQKKGLRIPKTKMLRLQKALHVFNPRVNMDSIMPGILENNWCLDLDPKGQGRTNSSGCGRVDRQA